MSRYYLDKTIGYWAYKPTTARRGLRLSFTRLGYPVVRGPKRLSKSRALIFLKVNQAWTKRHQPVVIMFKHGVKIGEYDINHIITDTPFKLSLNSKKRLLKVYCSNQDLTKPEVQELIWKKAAFILTKQVRTKLTEDAKLTAKTYGYQPNQIRVRPVTSRWGSCSINNDLTLSSFLIYLPDELKDYVIRHELVHLRVKHHQAKFWQELGLIQPNLAKIRKEIKNYRPNFYLS